MLAFPSLVVAVVLMVPLMLVIAWSDLRALRIPNRMILAIFLIFLVTGLPGGPAGLDWGHQWDTFLWRLGYAVAAFGVGFALYVAAGGRVGGGDLKMVAALAPFLSHSNLIDFVFLLAALCLIGLVLHQIARRVLILPTGWKAIDQNIYFPVGLALGLAITVVLVAELYLRWLKLP